MPRFLFAVLAVLLLPSLVSAQSSSRLEIFGGYSYLNNDYTLVSHHGLNGWNASVNFKPRPWLGLVADFSGFYPPSQNFGCPSCNRTGKAYTFLFGPQVSLPLHGFTPFAHFLIGDGRASEHLAEPLKSNNSFSFAAGGGLDCALSRHFALRGQLDWLHTGIVTTDDQAPTKQRSNSARISTGIVLRF